MRSDETGRDEKTNSEKTKERTKEKRKGSLDGREGCAVSWSHVIATHVRRSPQEFAHALIA